MNAEPGKYLTFALGHESYGIPVAKIREIIRMQDITAIPKVPDYVKGVINLRGTIIPVIDLRAKFSLPQVEITERTCIVVVQVQTETAISSMGLIVDQVEEVIQFEEKDMEATPNFGFKTATDYILGMAKDGDAVKTLLNIDKVIAADTLVQIHENVATA
jgi:purine-binding chemotaxis protein CheW